MLLFVPLANSITMYRLSPPTNDSQKATMFGWFNRARRLASCSVCFASAVVILPKGICVIERCRGSCKLKECHRLEVIVDHGLKSSSDHISLPIPSPILILEMADYLFDEAFLGVTFSPAQQSLSKASLSNDFLKLRAGDISCLTWVLKALVGAASHRQDKLQHPRRS